MKSIKPGRGPSFMNGIGSIFAIIFGIFWTFLAMQTGTIIFPMFGVFFVILGIIQAIYNFRNATGKNRYSLLDITDQSEESDPLNARFSSHAASTINSADDDFHYCPYCGTKLVEGGKFCQNCGKQIEQ